MSTFGTLAGLALVFLSLAIGVGIIYYGWPDFRKKK